VRPHRLRLEGIHSYADPAEVDFSRLKSGVFGIFGPTGSGKSTLLDAITLALYGSVDRSSRSRGVIHVARDKAFVAFTFSLEEGGNEVLYHVEREFRRSSGGDPFSVATRAARLLRRAPGDPRWVPLADRVREVDAAVRELLGLHEDDFLRSVILPQGRFAEFLTLAPAERKGMLERLFALERYGKVLYEKVKRRLETVEGELKVLEAELRSLGDTSKEALSALRREIRAAEDELTQVRGKLTALDGELLLLGRVREALESWAAHAEELLRREEEVPAARERERLLRQEEFLLTLVPHAERLAERKNALAELGQALERAQAEAENASTQKEELLRAVDAHRADGERDRRRLVELALRLRQLREARELLEEIVARGKGARESLERTKNQLRHIDERRQKLEEERERSAQAEKQAEAEKVRLEPFLAREGELRAAEKERWKIDEMRKRLRERAQDLRNLGARIQTLAFRTPDGLPNLRARLSRWESAYHKARVDERRLAERRDRLAEAVFFLRQRLERREREIEAERERLWTAHLAQKLVPGAPCPVCGSTHHPSPARLPAGLALWEAAAVGHGRADPEKHPPEDAVLEDERRIRELLFAARELEQRLRRLEFSENLEHLHARSEAVSEILAEARDLLSPLRPSSADETDDAEGGVALSRTFADVDLNLPSATTRGNLVSDGAPLDADRSTHNEGVLDALAREVSALEDEWRDALGRRLDLEKDLASLVQSARSLRERLRETKEEWERRAEHLATAAKEFRSTRSTWSERHRNIPYSEVDRLLRELEANRKAADAAETRRKAAAEKRRALEGEEKHLQEEWASLKTESARLEQELENMREEYARDAKRIDEEWAKLAGELFSFPPLRAYLEASFETALLPTGARPLPAQAAPPSEAEGRRRLSSPPPEVLQRLEGEAAHLAEDLEKRGKALEYALRKAEEAHREAVVRYERTLASLQAAEAAKAEAEEKWRSTLEKCAAEGFTPPSPQDLLAAYRSGHLAPDRIRAEREALEEFERLRNEARIRFRTAARLLRERLREAPHFPESEELAHLALDFEVELPDVTGAKRFLRTLKEHLAARERERAEREREKEGLQLRLGSLQNRLDELEKNRRRAAELLEEQKKRSRTRELLKTLEHLVQGRALVEFLGREHLEHLVVDAGAHLRFLSRGRYDLAVDESGTFLVQDYTHGGLERPASTLSGGERFLASLSLALALSRTVQLRGRHPLRFFFLDEGFGGLDPEALNTALTALERLETHEMLVGVISHVPEVRERISRRILVDPPEAGGRGSRLRFQGF